MLGFGVAQTQYPPVSGTAPDNDSPPVNCPGCRRLTLQITNQSVLITFGRGVAGAIVWDQAPEPYLPTVGSIAPSGGFDAFKYRAAIPAAQLPAGSTPAVVILTPRQ